MLLCMGIGGILGMIAGGMGYAMTAGVVLSLGQSMTIGAVSGNGCSLITDIEAMVIGGERLSVGQVLLNLTVSGGMGTEKIQRKNKKHRCSYCYFE